MFNGLFVDWTNGPQNMQLLEVEISLNLEMNVCLIVKSKSNQQKTVLIFWCLLFWVSDPLVGMFSARRQYRKGFDSYSFVTISKTFLWNCQLCWFEMNNGESCPIWNMVRVIKRITSTISTIVNYEIESVLSCLSY